MTTSTDITNRALQLIGTRTSIASLAEQSNEAIQANLVYNAVQSWCFGVINWNFARKVVGLTVAKSVAPPVGTWSTSSPQPPWLYEYKLPADFVRAIYLTNSSFNTTANWAGEPQRFALGTDTISAVQQEVLLTNQSPAILIYTSLITDPTLWIWSFERFMVTSLAWTLAPVLTGDKALVQYLDGVMARYYTIAEQANREESLIFNDSTPEWINALGIAYPMRQPDSRMPMSAPRPQPREEQQ